MDTEHSLLDMITEYKTKHPNFTRSMDNFHMSQEAYGRALALMSRTIPRKIGTYTLTNQGRYNVNVSKAH